MEQFDKINKRPLNFYNLDLKRYFQEDIYVVHKLMVDILT